ncbi:DNA-binding FadR family transcriptional regulator [Bosea sp. BE125]|uniref:FadR/GntR family transcriptional regulator n=1 Tax=Bosea sp. BE125 TaxID=2817909 RepID=UPI0028592DE7|nr:FadR/GntR family transcriptional regulator [Bosea sp. BE125]MDR6872053.1 DNA-binding FadR family transcriptional regulator [Bosea sp. BE125]
MPLEVVESPRLYRQIADQLRGLIERREFGVGSRLPPERELAEKLGVSRPSVREALIALEVEGIVRIKMGSGIYVLDQPAGAHRKATPPEGEGPFELLKARELIESGICREAAKVITPGDIAALDAILLQMGTGGLSSDELIRLDRAFHVTIAGTLGNGVLVRCVGELFDQRINPYFARLARYFEDDQSWRETWGEHGVVRDALAARDGAAAGRAMRRHIQNSQMRFSRSFGDGQGAENHASEKQSLENRISSGRASVSARPPRQK